MEPHTSVKSCSPVALGSRSINLRPFLFLWEMGRITPACQGGFEGQMASFGRAFSPQGGPGVLCPCLPVRSWR